MSVCTIDPLWPVGELVALCARLTGKEVRELRASQAGDQLFVEVDAATLKRALAEFDPVTAARRLALGRVRAERNRRLAATDWQALRAIEQGRLPEFLMGPEAARRQALRDLPARLAAEGALERLADCGALNRFEPTWP